MKRFLLIPFLMFSQMSKADDFHLVDVDRLAFEGKRVTDDNDPFFPGKTDWYQKCDLYWNIRLVKYIWMESDTYGITDYSQFREVGWHFTQGINLYTPAFAVVHEHESRHNLDHSNNGIHFPVQDSFGFRINFINK